MTVRIVVEMRVIIIFMGRQFVDVLMLGAVRAASRRLLAMVFLVYCLGPVLGFMPGYALCSGVVIG